MSKRLGFLLVVTLIGCIAVLQVVFLLGAFVTVPFPFIEEQINFITLSYHSIIYIVVGILLLIEINDLAQFHIDKFTITTFLLASFLRTKASGDLVFRIVIGLMGIAVIAGLIVVKPNVLKTNLKSTFFGMGIALISILLISAFELVLRGNWLLPPLIKNSLILTVLNSIVKELSMGALTEEIIFRGFLWGYLKGRNLPENTVLWIQGILFWLLHIGRFSTPITFFFFIPILTLIVSKLTYRNKQVFPAIIVHIIMNSVGALLNLAAY